MGKRVLIQSFVRRIGQFDLLVVENALHNLSYPLSSLAQGFGKRVMVWGHGSDLSVGEPSGGKLAMERLKMMLATSQLRERLRVRLRRQRLRE